MESLIALHYINTVVALLDVSIDVWNFRMDCIERIATAQLPRHVSKLGQFNTALRDEFEWRLCVVKVMLHLRASHLALAMATYTS